MSCTTGNDTYLSQNKAKSIFWNVFAFAIVIQIVRTSIFLTDHGMWTSQIQYFLSNNPRQFNFFAAYGHPGTTLVVLGSIFHILFGLSYGNALTLGLAILIAAATAACAALCYLLQPQSLWWFTTGFILTLSRFYVKATPPTAVVTSFIALIVLASCWLWKRSTASRWLYFVWGFILGLSTVTRFDITLLVGIPLLILLLYRIGSRFLVPVLIGGVTSLVIFDPYLWFMPVQHIRDLVHNLIIHSSHNAGYYVSLKIGWLDWIHGVPLAALSIAWFLRLNMKRRMSSAVPAQIIAVFLGCSLLAFVLLVLSKSQAIRYLYPLLMVWEILLPLFALQDCSRVYNQVPLKNERLDAQTMAVIAGFVIPAQIIGYLLMFSV